MRNRITVVLASFCISLFFLCTCSTPQHTNTLIFGTNTKLAVDISASTPPTPPGLTVGYARQEFVWLPLDVNTFTNNSLASCNAAASNDCKYIGEDTGHGASNATKTDSYSVFASFGASASQGGGVGIASYFATGLAARALATHGASLVNTRASAVAAVIPTVSLFPTIISFGEVAANTTSPSQTVTITNTSTVPVTINSLQLAETDASQFAASLNCGKLPADIPVAGNCTANVNFAPNSTAGVKGALLIINLAAPVASQTISLYGTGK